MNKVNLSWVLSDDRAGHEIQSLSLAETISSSVKMHKFSLKQPWRSITPKRLPFFQIGLRWLSKAPDMLTPPQVIITCGKTAAAVGKHYVAQTGAQHIQILNPRDQLNHYDLLLIPEHDQQQANNVISTKGSLHNINDASLKQFAELPHAVIDALDKPILAVMLGDPGSNFYADCETWCQQLKQTFPQHSVFICGSRRTPRGLRTSLQAVAQQHQMQVWFDSPDGDNPYKKLLAIADYFIVSADSINMVSEACATTKPVALLPHTHITSKHQRFIDSLGNRITSFGAGIGQKYTALNELHRIKQHDLLQTLLKKAQA